MTDIVATHETKEHCLEATTARKESKRTSRAWWKKQRSKQENYKEDNDK